MSCISEFSFLKCYELLYFREFPENSNLFYLKKYFITKDIGISIT